MFFLTSGIDLKKIEVSSFDTKGANLHTYKEDFEIASEIAKDFGFELNRTSEKLKMIFPFEKSINLRALNSYLFHKSLPYPKDFYLEPIYYFTGYGGENIRQFWQLPFYKFLSYVSKPSFYPESRARFLNRAFGSIYSKKFMFSPDSPSLSQYFYKWGRARHHFGNWQELNLFSNMFTLSPLMDSELQKVKLENRYTKDLNLFYCLLIDRYCPQLLKYKFDSNRKLEKKTLEIARKLNSENPVSFSQFSDKFVIENSPIIPSFKDSNIEPESRLYKIFDSPTTINLVKEYGFGEYYKKIKDTKNKSEIEGIIQLVYLLSLLSFKHDLEVDQWLNTQYKTTTNDHLNI